MASTVIQVDVIEDTGPVKAYLFDAEGGLVAPSAAGYVLTLDGSTSWLYTFTVTEACVGIYRVELQDGDGVTVGQGYVWIQADDTNTYVAGPDFGALKHRKDAQANIDDWADGGRLDTLLDAILLDTGTSLPSSISGNSSSLSSIISTLSTIATDTTTEIPASITSLASDIAALNDITAAEVLAAGDVDGYSLEESLKLIGAVLLGKVSGAGTITNIFRAADDSKNRITATVDSEGNRTLVTLDATG